ncbi:MAG: Hsp70 family protein [Schlesneria sp.]
MLPTHAVGIDLGTTYSCIAYLNEHGEPISIPNKDGELSTPSAVLFDGNDVIVGTEAMRNSIRHSDRVVVHAKRYMGSPSHRWKIAGKSYSPVDISTFILKSMLETAREKIGPVTSAVITVPAQFSDIQRQATAEAGRRAGLTNVDIINEPVAAALCFVLGTEGIWFTELATTQTVMVVDLGGGTFDLSLVKYQKNEVSVLASGGDLHLGGLDWNKALEVAIGKQFQKEFGIDPMKDRESAQALSLEAEQTKRSLSVRPKAALTVAAGGQRKTYQVEVDQFERLTKDLVDRMEKLTLGLLEERKMGWAKVDVVLTTGGSSRMPMVRSMLKRLSGRTLNTSLSPDQSIAHGATYYAGMLLTNSSFAKSILNPTAAARLAQFKQKSTNARAFGILVRDHETGGRIPHYILPAHTPLPTSVSQIYGTVKENQRRVHLRIVESGTAADAAYVELGTCMIEPLPENLPQSTEIEVTITYDEQARVHVAAKVLATGQETQTEIIRPENLVVSALNEEVEVADVNVKSEPAMRPIPSVPSNEISAPPITASQPKSSTKPIVSTPPMSSAKSGTPSLSSIENSFQPIPLCNQCGEPIDSNGKCASCESKSSVVKPTAKPGAPGRTAPGMAKLSSSNSAPLPAAPKKPATSDKLLYDEDSIIELLVESEGSDKPQSKQAAPSTKPPVKAKIKPPPIPAGGAAQVKLIPGKPLEPSKSEPEDDSAFWEAVGQD